MYFLIVLAVLFPADIFSLTNIFSLAVIFSLAFLILLSLFAETLILIYIVISVIGKVPSSLAQTRFAFC